MVELESFVLAALALLLTPGPTNTLLAAGGATRGARRALPLIGAEMAGYAGAITALELFLAPLADASAWVGLALRVGCGLYLAYVAWRLWRPAIWAEESAISFRRVFLATLSNPKAMVFVFVILPPRSIGLGPLLYPHGVVLLALIALAGGAWVLFGALVRAGAGGRGAALVRRSSSVVVALFSLTILAGAAAWPALARPLPSPTGPGSTPGKAAGAPPAQRPPHR